jgi:hypothetical protein
MDALTSAILRQNARPAPTLYLAEQALQVATNGDQTLLIRGRELWRNPAVIVGSTPADAVDLLPDMRGLIAHFKSVPATYEPEAWTRSKRQSESSPRRKCRPTRRLRPSSLVRSPSTAGSRSCWF